MKQPDTRIESLDLLKGVVMVIMALDHVRDYFHYSSFFFDPADPVKSNLPVFATRFVTHFCAPIFSFLAGTSAFLIGRKKTTPQLSGFLFKRGLWLIFVELFVVGFAWSFDIHLRTLELGPIFSLGFSMVVLAGLIYLPETFVLIFSLLLIFGHDLLDGIHFPGTMGWSLIHEEAIFKLSDSHQLMIGYPVVPWIAVMPLGFYFGKFYRPAVEGAARRKLFNITGSVSLALFFVLRLTNVYGDPTRSLRFGNLSQDLISFFNPNKYPPSLQYLLMTLGVCLVFLANTEKWKGAVVNFFSTFGRAPFFYYIIHLFLIHLLAVIFAGLSGYGWNKMILSTMIFLEPGMKGYGFPLWVVYAVWISVILLLYPFCKRFYSYKQQHREKWWLTYL